MRRWVLVLVAAATLLGLYVLSVVGWLAASPLLVAAAWLTAVERSIGVARFARFDPWPPRTKRGRRLRAALITTVLLATLPLSFVVGLKHPDAPAVVLGSYVFLCVYTWWAIGFIKSYGVERVIRVNVPE